ncbi:carbohydrate ABC transporter permease [Deinococcus altitudinis]|uniref:carbohydrate ABC transporter permease n=1 Tax=Deinococcus altitudinis TaxID=468914 RepID=UPI003891D5D9
MAAPSVPVSSRPARRKPVRLGNYLFILPAVAFLLLFMVYPIALNISMSFKDVTASTLLGGAPWVGLKNYVDVIRNPAFGHTVSNTVIFTLASLVFQIAIGLALAVFYNRSFPGYSYMRGLYLLAWSIPIVVSGTVWRWLFDGESGVINYLLRSLHLANDRIYWTSDAQFSLAAVIVVNIWLGIPFNLSLLLAAMQGLPQEVYEAAEIDGATRAQQFRYVTLPLLRPALLSTLVLGLIYTIKVFDVVFITTAGGPLDSSQVLSTFAYKLVFQQYQFGQGAALLNMLFVLLLILAVFYVRSISREERS